MLVYSDPSYGLQSKWSFRKHVGILFIPQLFRIKFQTPLHASWHTLVYSPHNGQTSNFALLLRNPLGTKHPFVPSLWRIADWLTQPPSYIPPFIWRVWETNATFCKLSFTYGTGYNVICLLGILVQDVECFFLVFAIGQSHKNMRFLC